MSSCLAPTEVALTSIGFARDYIGPEIVSAGFCLVSTDPLFGPNSLKWFQFGLNRPYLGLSQFQFGHGWSNQP